MSRGLGLMQRRILDALCLRDGGDEVIDGSTGDTRFELPPGVHDLRRVSKELARRHGGISHCDFVSATWEASFSRAVRSLRRRRLIERVGWPQTRYVRVLPFLGANT
jgi:hypothetical protein